MPWDERTKRRLKLRNLDVLMALAHTGTMGKAANQLNISQPAVSNAIAELEHAVDAKLVERSRRGIELTTYGQAFVKRGIAVFDELRQGFKDIEYLADPTAGEVRVGGTERIAAAILAPAIDRLSRQYPRMRFRVVTGDSAPLLADLDARNVEFVIHRLSPRAGDGHHHDTLFHDEMLVVTGAENPLARRRKMELAELMDEPWVLVPADSYAGAWQMAVFHASGLPLPRLTVVAAGSVALRNALLELNRFLTIATRASRSFFHARAVH